MFVQFNCVWNHMELKYASCTEAIHYARSTRKIIFCKTWGFTTHHVTFWLAFGKCFFNLKSFPIFSKMGA